LHDATAVMSLACVEVQLSCWASWQEDGYWFIVAGSPASQLPHYVLVNCQSLLARLHIV